MIQILHHLKDAAETKKPLHLAIGIFDGVHLGHQEVIRAATQAADGSNGTSGVLTFEPHPSHLFKPDNPTLLIMPREAKAHALEKLGIDTAIFLNFTPDFAAIEAEQFLAYLQQAIPQLAAVYVGDNFRFGKQRSGDLETLVRTGDPLGIRSVHIPAVKQDEVHISSTQIRQFLQEGLIHKANECLGYPYFSIGQVIPGKQLGRSIGFPTLNLNWSPELYPRYGVYAVKVKHSQNTQSSYGVANYGLRPTVGTHTQPLLEVHLFESPPLSMEADIHVEWHHFIRPEQKFASLDQLKHQITQDISKAKQCFNLDTGY